MAMIERAESILTAQGYEAGKDFLGWADSVRVTSERLPVAKVEEAMTRASLETLQSVDPTISEGMTVVTKEQDWTYSDRRRKLFQARLKRNLKDNSDSTSEAANKATGDGDDEPLNRQNTRSLWSSY